MDTTIAYCGLTCKSCPIHLATLEKDEFQKQVMRKSIAEQCSQYDGLEFKTEEITDCDGCRANTGNLFKGCLNCRIRACAIQKAVESCASCAGYPCSSLKDLFTLDPGAQSRLEEIRKTNRI